MTLAYGSESVTNLMLILSLNHHTKGHQLGPFCSAGFNPALTFRHFGLFRLSDFSDFRLSDFFTILPDH
jgi:hypothetical protein